MMFVSVELREFEKIFEIVDYEIAVSERIEQQLLDIANQSIEYQSNFINQQIFFSKELSKELREKRDLLTQVLERFSKLKESTSIEINDSLAMLKKMDTT